eukprot:2010237-Pyramimonas_sp.AAC.1
MAAIVLERGSTVNSRALFAESGRRLLLQRGFTPLYIAASEGHLKVVQQLLTHPQIDVNTMPVVLVRPNRPCRGARGGAGPPGGHIVNK